MVFSFNGSISVSKDCRVIWYFIIVLESIEREKYKLIVFNIKLRTYVKKLEGFDSKFEGVFYFL